MIRPILFISLLLSSAAPAKFDISELNHWRDGMYMPTMDIPIPSCPSTSLTMTATMGVGETDVEEDIVVDFQKEGFEELEPVPTQRKINEITGLDDSGSEYEYEDREYDFEAMDPSIDQEKPKTDNYMRIPNLKVTSKDLRAMTLTLLKADPENKKTYEEAMGREIGSNFADLTVMFDAPANLLSLPHVNRVVIYMGKMRSKEFTTDKSTVNAIWGRFDDDKGEVVEYSIDISFGSLQAGRPSNWFQFPQTVVEMQFYYFGRLKPLLTRQIEGVVKGIQDVLWFTGRELSQGLRTKIEDTLTKFNYGFHYSIDRDEVLYRLFQKDFKRVYSTDGTQFSEVDPEDKDFERFLI